ncbi:hypothetical protein VB712_05050 [Spirulina sp. CCNP1310]|nr:hypothetical protein [Spirulina sp. CCNP1310]
MPWLCRGMDFGGSAAFWEAEPPVGHYLAEPSNEELVGQLG